MSFNARTYRFDCADDEAGRLEDIAHYVKQKLDAVMLEHGAIGDERLVLMVALTLADELFDARADIDDLLGGKSSNSAAAGAAASAAGDDSGARRDAADAET